VARFRYGSLFALTLAIAVFALFVRDGNGARAAELIAAGAGLLIAVATSGAPGETRRDAIVVLAAATAGVGAATAAGALPTALPLGLTSLLLALTIVVISRGLLRLVLERGVGMTAVFGALAVYLLLGLTFGFLIGAVAAGVDGSYFAQNTDATQSDRVYFSFTVLTTTGFGDLTARTRPGHALAVVEMLAGQLYLVTVISVLVSNLRRSST